jgi:CBS domain-containing protein
MSQSDLIARPLAVVMNRRLRSVDAGMTLADAAVVMREEKTGALLVTEQGRYVGIVSETDLVRRGIAARLDLSVESVRRVMSSPIISIEIDRTAHEASDLMAECNIRHLPVTEEERIVGIVSVRDLLRYFKNWGS